MDSQRMNIKDFIALVESHRNSFKSISLETLTKTKKALELKETELIEYAEKKFDAKFVSDLVRNNDNDWNNFVHSLFQLFQEE
jgi:hypothetical protein